MPDFFNLVKLIVELIVGYYVAGIVILLGFLLLAVFVLGAFNVAEALTEALAEAAAKKSLESDSKPKV